MKKEFVLVVAFFAMFYLSGPLEAGEKNKKASTEVVKQIVQKMTKDGILTKSCIDEAGGPNGIITVTEINLSKNGKPQFEVSGNAATSCTMGARSSYFWIYDNKDNGYRLLLDAGATDQLNKTKEMTNGYFDVEAGSYLQAGAVLYVDHFKFNGEVYKKAFSKEIKNKQK